MPKSWSIVGAGPVGSMQAVLLTTVFPGQTLNILDQRPVHQRNHGLQIRNATINDINAQLDQIATQIKESVEANSDYNQLVLENITKTKQFLEQSFKSITGGQFIRTKNISIKLQKFAEELGQHNAEVLHQGSIKFHMGDAFKIGETQLSKLKAPSVIDTAALSEAEQMLHESKLIFGADGSHSQVRTHIFNDPEPEKDVIQYLVEIKLDMKTKTKEPSTFSSSQKSVELMESTSDFVTHSIVPTLRRGKLHVWTVGHEGTATLHILVKKEIYDTLLSKNNPKGNMGVPGNPYTRLRQLPMGNGVRSLITEAIRDTIGLNEIKPETIKITTIPMHVYSAKSLVTIVGGKAYIIPGDSGAGLIFIRGVNHGLQSAMAYVSALFQLWHPLKSPEDIAQYEFPEQVPPALIEGERKLKAMYERKVHEIKAEQGKIDLAMKVIETSHAISHTSSKLCSSNVEEKEWLYEPDQLKPQVVLRALLQELDNELDRIAPALDEEGNDLHINYQGYRSWLPALDLLANEFDKQIYQLENTPEVPQQDRQYLTTTLKATINLVKKVTATQDKKQQNAHVLEFKNLIEQLNNTETDQQTLFSSIKDTVRSMLYHYAPSVGKSIFAGNIEKAADAVVDARLTSNL